MGSPQTLSHSVQRVDQFYAWKQGLLEQIQTYCSWLSENGAASEDVIKRLARTCLELQEDELTLALVGEFSRGKTELINALLHTENFQRILPSKAGRTTMCPTELFYDRRVKRSYLRLLPIESRRLNLTITEMKQKTELWESYKLDELSQDDTSKILECVAEVVSVSKDEALALGFEESMQEQDLENPEKVIIPRWRHAQLSLKHPLLQQGVRILDTPGLNALGSEPELTVSMIPNAQAVVFLLSADAGVTASDMAIWNQYISPNGEASEKYCYALLNKIDVLWDDLQGETYTAAAIESVKQDTARKLGIAAEHVLPVSAKKALHAKVKQDDALGQKSGLQKFENLLIEQLVNERERLLYSSAISDISSLVQSSEKVIRHQLVRAKQHLLAHERNEDAESSLNDIGDQTQQDHAEFYRKLVALRSSRRLMMSQKEILHELVHLDKFDALADDIRRAMQDAWSTKGLIEAMRRFFYDVDRVFDNLMVEIRVAEKMVDSMYARFKQDHQADHLHPTRFSIKKYRQKLSVIKAKFVRYRRNPKLLMTEQTLVIKHFKNAFVHDVRKVYEELAEQAACWADDALLPLMQYTVEQKEALRQQMESFQSLAQEKKSQREECSTMQKRIDMLKQQLALTHSIAKQLEAHSNT
ncbi:hypothetical protein A3762_01235 [Oleiphilus sp. HI0125]|uniref:dynamin family protein n=1 Tax=Oleiphilus sp. HI0125 TaxID=1822266 RepID=UPI0007C382A8|nr:dynamin family protein [Oleiphilus sp. HI0125]KZZ57274.1 hypothetical protein A3762_01235 [Oleiphilus sp. HI0125]